MGLKPYLGPTLAAFFVCAVYSALAQSVPAARESRLPLAIGAGFSGYIPDYGHGHLLGGTLWIDYTLPHMPSLLHGLSLEAEGRDLNYGRSSLSTSESARGHCSGRLDVFLAPLPQIPPLWKVL